MNRVLHLLVLLAVASGTKAGDAVWTSGGPYGGDVYRLVQDPAISGRAYATARGGIFRKEDTNSDWQPMMEGLLATPYTSGPLVQDTDDNEALLIFDNNLRLYRSSVITDPYAPPGAQTRVIWTPTGYALPSALDPTDLVEAQGGSDLVLVGTANFNAPAVSIGTSLLFRSTDGGASFSPVADLPIDVDVLSVAIDPNDRQHILVGLAEITTPAPGPAEPSIWESTDGGASFAKSYYGVPASTTSTQPVLDLVFGANDRVFALSGASILVSDARGAANSWLATSASLFTSGASGTNKVCLNNEWLAAHRTDQTIVYSFASGVSKWSIAAPGSPEPLASSFSSINTLLTPNSTLVGTSGLNVGQPPQSQVCSFQQSPTYPSPGSFLLATTLGSGLFRTLPATEIWGASLNEGLGGVNVRAMGFNPAATSRLLAGLGDNFFGSTGMFGSNDSAANWFAANSGLRASSVRHLLFDPTSTSGSPGNTIVYAAGRAPISPSTQNDAGYRSVGIFRSVDSGNTWTSLNGDLPAGAVRNYLNVVRWITLDPRSCGAPPFPSTSAPCPSGTPGGLKRLYAAADGFRNPSNTSDPDYPGMSVSRVTHRLVRSDDYGTTYTDLSQNPGFPPSVQIFDPTISSIRMVQFVTPYKVVLDPSDSQRMFVPTFATAIDDFPEDAYSPDVPSGMFFSNDGGQTFSERNGTAPNELPRLTGRSHLRQSLLAAEMHPVNANVLWVAAVELGTETITQSGGIYRTTDGGLNWLRVSEGLPDTVDIRALIYDPEDPQLATGDPDQVTLYAASAGLLGQPGAVYRSDDGGMHWRSISVGLPAASGFSLAVDPADRRRILAGTDFGVWELTQLPDADGDGIPDATEGGTGAGGYDGNNDGIADAVQRDVGSIGVSLLRQAGGGNAITSDVIQALSTPSEPGGCEQTEDLQSLPSINFGQDLAGSGPRRFFYPMGLWRIQINACSQATVDISYPATNFVSEYGWSFRYFGPATPGDEATVGWHSFTSRAHLLPPTVNTWRLQLNANQFGSYRTDPDRILFVGGPACYDDRMLRDGFESSGSTQIACGGD